MKLTPEDIATGTQGRLLHTGEAGRVCTDTRAIKKGDWFLALKGERFDAHDFVDAAIAAGASGVIAERVPEGWSAGHVLVDDGLTALQNLARFVRNQFEGPVIGITGSAGKTTSRALIGLAIEPLGAIHQTRGNFNNHIGLPLTLLSMPDKADALVLEMGMNHSGEISLLQDIGKPTVRIITNVGVAHLEGLGSIEAIAAAKGELFDGARTSDICCVNMDDARVAKLPIPKGVSIIRYGSSPDCDVRLLDAHVDPDTLHTHFTVATKTEKATGTIPSPGIHMAHNAVGAVAVGVAFDLPLKPILTQISRYEPVGMRLRMEPGPQGTQIINDAYNANPMSVAANLRTLANIPPSPDRRRIALLGDMLELGETELQQHSETAQLAKSLGLDRVGFVGPRFKSVIEPSDLWAPEAEALGAQLQKELRTGDIILIKGSRGMRMERVLDGIQSKETA